MLYLVEVELLKIAWLRLADEAIELTTAGLARACDVAITDLECTGGLHGAACELRSLVAAPSDALQACGEERLLIGLRL